MSINSSVSGFLEQVQQGVRPNMFQVDITFPGDGTQTEKALLSQFMCKSAALPASNVGVIEVPFRGRTVKIAGDRTFDNWSATFINDKDMKIRSYFEEWMKDINTHQGNTAEVVSPTAYGRDILIKQKEKTGAADNLNGKDIRAYKLWYAFPTSVSAIDLAYDSNDQIEEFSVEFQYSYWTVESGDAGNSTIAIP